MKYVLSFFLGIITVCLLGAASEHFYHIRLRPEKIIGIRWEFSSNQTNLNNDIKEGWQPFSAADNKIFLVKYEE